MSDILDPVVVTPQKVKITPQLPNSASVVPSVTPTTIPAVPAMNAPNVTGGSASFSGITSALQEFADTKKKEIETNIAAMNANNSIDATLAAQLKPLRDATIGALGNVQKTELLPGGPSGKIAHVLSIFNSDYNVGYQETQSKINQQKMADLSASAAAIKERNNALPAIMGKISDASKLVFDMQKDANSLFIQQQTLENQQAQTKIAKAHLQIDMSQEARAAWDFKARSLNIDQAQAQLEQAKQGKGPWAGKVGILEDRVLSEQMSHVNLLKAQIGAAKDNREEVHASTVEAVANMYPDVVAKRLAEAQAAGKPTVTLPVGVDAKGNPIPGEVPIGFVQEGLQRGRDLETKANVSAAAEVASNMKIVPTLSNLTSTATAFAGINPKATQILTNINSVMGGIDFKTASPQQVRQFGLLADDYKAQMSEVIKQEANKYATPEAKAAILSLDNGGKFDIKGASAVVAESAGLPSLGTRSIYKGAWNQLNTYVATSIAAQHVQGSYTVSSPSQNLSVSDGAALIAQMTAKNDGREKINTITQEILADPTKAKVIGAKMTAAIQSKSINDTLLGMAKQKNANPIWQDLYEHTDQVLNDKGQIDFGLVMNKLEAASVATGGKINYANSFISGLRNYGLNAENMTANDPSYTLQDRAVEMAIFGHNPYNAIVGDVTRRMSDAAKKAHAEMQARIQQDLTGVTQRSAVMNANPVFEEYPGPTDNAVFGHTTKEQIYKRTGVNIDNVPSATGTGMTAEQIKQLYGGR